MTDSPAIWGHNFKTTELTYVSDSVLLHPGNGGMNFNIEFRTQRGITYTIVFKNSRGKRLSSHIFECPVDGFFLNGDIIEASPIKINGIENHYPNDTTTRKITITDSNFFNKLIRKHNNRE